MDELEEKKSYLKELEIYCQISEVHIDSLKEDIAYYKKSVKIEEVKISLNEHQLQLALERHESTIKLIESLKNEINNLQ